MSIDSLNLTPASITVLNNGNENHVWKKTAWTLVKIAGGVLVCSSLMAGIGCLLQISGVKLISFGMSSASPLSGTALRIGTAAGKAGDGLFLIGKYGFLSVAVPAYAVGWVAPKWVIQHGIPQVAKLSHKYILVPVCRGAVRILKHLNQALIKVAQLIYNYVLQPFGCMIQRLAVWTWHAVIIPIANELARLKDPMIRVAQAVYNHALKPLGRAALKSFEWTWKYVVAPLSREIVKAAKYLDAAVVRVARTVYHYALKPLSRAAVKTFVWTWKYVVTPISREIVKAARYTGDVAWRTALAVDRYVLEPLGRGAIKAFEWTWKVAVIPVSHGIIKAAGYAGSAALRGAEAVYHYALKPLSRAAIETFQWTWNCAIIPVSHGIVKMAEYAGSAACRTAQAVYDLALLPAGRLAAKASRTACEYTGHLLKTVTDSGRAAAYSIYDTYAWLSQRLSAG